MACVGALYVLKIAETAVPVGLLAGDEYSVTSCTNPVSGQGWEDLKQNWVFLAGLSDTTSEESCQYPWDHLDYLKTCHLSSKTGTLGCREAGRAVGDKDIILLQHPLRWEWRCSGSFIISSLILFNSGFLHTRGMWVYFSECENAFIFCWQVWSLWKTNGCATAAALGLGFASRGKKPFQRSIFIS